MNENTQKQLEIAERLQTKWLIRMEAMIDDGSVTATDLATLARFLMANGWTLDPSRMPQGLRDKLTSHLDPTDFEDDDADVLPLARGA